MPWLRILIVRLPIVWMIQPAIYCYEDSALSTFQAAARMGLKRYYELPIMYWQTAQRLLRQEAERYPEWEPTLLRRGIRMPSWSVKAAELQLADLVICPSRQVQNLSPVRDPESGRGIWVSRTGD